MIKLEIYFTDTEIEQALNKPTINTGDSLLINWLRENVNILLDNGYVLSIVPDPPEYNVMIEHK